MRRVAAGHRVDADDGRHEKGNDMRVLVIGATGRTGRLLAAQLAASGHEVRGMIRDSAKANELRDIGAEPVHGDLDGELGTVFDSVDAVAFCAGSGGHTGADATARIDLHGAVRSLDECTRLGIRRFVMLSSWNAPDPMANPKERRHYFAAKHAVDRILMASGLDYTIVRPGKLTDDPPTGRVQVGSGLPRPGQVPRADLAAVLAACLEEPATIGAAFELVSGDVPIADALREIAPVTE
ncbi:MAG: SDR family oxidoreductase [Nitriliruptoraceae bacterium]